MRGKFILIFSKLIDPFQEKFRHVNTRAYFEKQFKQQN